MELVYWWHDLIRATNVRRYEYPKRWLGRKTLPIVQILIALVREGSVKDSKNLN